jgi:hypothetical protein
MTASKGADGHGKALRWRRHPAAVVSLVSIGIVLLWLALPSPWGVGVFERQSPPARGVFGTTHIDEVLHFVDSEQVPVATVWGDVHVNLTGRWSASAPTWQVRDYSGFYSVPPCWPRCGNSSESGVVNWTEDFCTNWPGGGTSYFLGPTLTFYLVFSANSNASDTVWTHLTLVVTPSSACA